MALGLVAGILLDQPSSAAPKVDAEHAALVKRSVAHQGTSGQDAERKRLVAARHGLDAQSASARGPQRRSLAKQEVAGNSAARKSIAAGSAAHQHVPTAPRPAKSPS